MIFDGFESRLQADTFATTVAAEFGLAASVYDTQDQSDAVDIFPFTLNPPIVLVPRAAPKLEARVQVLVERFGGSFAGT